MGQLNASMITKAVKKLFSALDTTDEDLVMNTVNARRKIRVYVTDGGTAATAQTATPFFTNDLGSSIRILSVKILTPVAVTANASNNMTATLTKVDAAGGSAAVVAVYTSDVAGGSTVAHVPKALTLTVANVVLAAGGSLHIAVSKGGTGVALAAATSQAYVEVTFELEA